MRFWTYFEYRIKSFANGLVVGCEEKKRSYTEHQGLLLEQLEGGSCCEPRGKTNGVQAGEKIRNLVVGIYILDPFQYPNGEHR